MKTTKLLLPILCVGLLLTGCGAKTIPTLEDGKEVIAQLEGKDITVEELYEELKSQGGYTVLIELIDKYIANEEYPENEDALEYADAEIATLKAQYEAYGQDFDAALESSMYKTIDKFKEVLALDYKKNKVVEDYVASTVTDKDIEKYYNNEIEGAMNVHYILIQPETTDDMTDEQKTEAENKALNEAKEVIKKLKDGEDFEELAKEHSDDKTTAPEGGLYEGFEKDEVVSEFWNAAVALKDGKYTTEPVKSVYGYFVILRDSQDEKPKLEDVEDDIIDTLVSEKLAADEKLNSKAWVEVRKNYGLDIIDSDILDDYNKTIKEYK